MHKRLPLPPQEVVQQGWLTKQPLNNAFGLSRKRYMVLLGDALLWFKDNSVGSTPRGALSLCSDAAVLHKRSRVAVCSDGSVLILRGCQGDLADWARALGNQILLVRSARTCSIRTGDATGSQGFLADRVLREAPASAEDVIYEVEEDESDVASCLIFALAERRRTSNWSGKFD
mmetsp:Transcript_23717/g.39166  ORF Transcript_23717/g.39166 Transcript_23717/m.39166 type:complete len:174 (+) Transcript_23717:99-620(+)